MENSKTNVLDVYKTKALTENVLDTTKNEKIVTRHHAFAGSSNENSDEAAKTMENTVKIDLTDDMDEGPDDSNKIVSKMSDKSNDEIVNTSEESKVKNSNPYVTDLLQNLLEELTASTTDKVSEKSENAETTSSGDDDGEESLNTTQEPPDKVDPIEIFDDDEPVRSPHLKQANGKTSDEPVPTPPPLKQVEETSTARDVDQCQAKPNLPPLKQIEEEKTILPPLKQIDGKINATSMKKAEKDDDDLVLLIDDDEVAASPALVTPEPAENPIKALEALTANTDNGTVGLMDVNEEGILPLLKSVNNFMTEPQSQDTVEHNTTENSTLDTLNEMVAKLKSPIEDDSMHSEENDLVIDEDKLVDLPPIIRGNCMNNQCASTTDLFVAPLFVCNFYAHNLKKNKKYCVCQSCYDAAVKEYERYCDSLVCGRPLLQMDLPVREEIVELSDDSDEENDTYDDGDKKVSGSVLKLLEEELENVIQEQLQRVKIDQQTNWTKQLLEKKIDNNGKMCDEIMAELRDMERKAYDMGRKLHSVNEAQRVILPSLDITSMANGRMYKERYDIPSYGQLPRPAMEIGGTFYGVKTRLLGAWTQCKVVDVIETKDRPVQFKIAFFEQKNPTRIVPGKYLAYSHPPPVRLRVGDRVIALFNNSQDNNQPHMQKNQYFPGVIAEPLQTYNNSRYLVFFDDGYAQYVTHQDVRLVYEASPNVWEDVHPHAKEFINEYLINYRKERPLVQVKRGQRMITELKGQWHQAKVVEADASLVRVFFEGLKRLEWIYRGSTRLGPLYREKQNKRNQSNQAPKRNEPSVEYITIVDDDEQSRTAKFAQPTSTGPQPRSVARKSSSAPMRPSAPAPPPPTKVQNLNNSTIILDDDIGKGRVVYYTARKNYKLPKFKSHTCGPDCLFKNNNDLKHYSPISKPLLCGWERQVVKTKAKKIIFYKAPCGRRLRNIIELHQYIRLTECPLGVECFDYDINLHALSEYIVEKAIFTLPDISEGQEGVPVPCVNYFDETRPPPLKYSSVRIPTEGVNLNLDEEFLCGCDCEDDCLDKTKCSCQVLTINGAKYGNPNLPKEQVGYQYKRLFEQVRTGIYECNPRCKCSKSCLNRVVQNPITNKLQLFKTNNRGWGLRATSDIPRGTFICVYAGYLLTEQRANEYGGDHGDEYFADLDYIEIAEETKQGYESDAPEMSDESDEYDPEDDRTVDDDYVSFGSVKRVTRQNSRSSTEAPKAQKKKDKTKTPSRPVSTTPSSEGDTNDGDRERINLLPDQMGNVEDMPAVDEADKSLRRFYGKDESVYVMDAKITGNIGRYFNHSCEPNMFVQNVFVDTHDLRFPWIAFFAICYIRAGTELTWNYNYDVGSVPGKVLYCQCGTPNCRQRLL